MIATKRTISSASLVAVALVVAGGCGSYGRISPTAYEFAKALYSICNRQAHEALDPVGDQITQAQEEGELSEQEASWLGDVIAHARDGDWDAAAAAARQMMEDQVRDE